MTEKLFTGTLNKNQNQKNKNNCNNAHVTELRCVIIGNFRFSNRYQSEEHEMASFKVQVMCHRLINCISKFIECL